MAEASPYNSIEEYRIYLKMEKALSELTIKAYITDLEKLISFNESYTYSKELNDLNASDIREFLYQFRDHVGPRTLARTISSIRNYYDYLIYSDQLDKNPLDQIESPKYLSKLPEVLHTYEIDALIDQIDLSSKQGERNRLIIELLYSCGLRVTELVSLQIGDLYFEEEVILVKGKGNKERVVPICASLKKYLLLYMDEIRSAIAIKKGNENILLLNNRGSKLSRVMIFHIIKSLAQKAGIQKTISPHTFRHSFASHLIENGADLRAVQELLGHESILTTEIYTHLDNNFIRQEIIHHHPRVKK